MFKIIFDLQFAISLISIIPHTRDFIEFSLFFVEIELIDCFQNWLIQFINNFKLKFQISIFFYKH